MKETVKTLKSRLLRIEVVLWFVLGTSAAGVLGIPTGTFSVSRALAFALGSGLVLGMLMVVIFAGGTRNEGV